ncbi:MAG: hypothetical protein J6R47_05345, partial [Acholeplasmatales bacterium]|nr:hypothetical protein [Acholeplasmatales bacterium]
MNTKLYLSLDLGGDTIKICFGFVKNGKEYIGKIVNSESILPDPIPAAAYYDEETKEWYYGDDIESRSNGSFLTVVKIKKLLSLLRKISPSMVFESNKDYYLNKHEFPKFYFPEKNCYYEDNVEMIDSDMTFIAPGYTPKMVCENFFKYIANIVAKEINDIRTIYGVEFNSLSITAVTPTYYGSAFSEELNRLISNAFNHEINLSIDANKAMCFSAYQQELFKVNDKILVFDMGEERISVVKAMLVQDNDGAYVGVDASDAHSEPIEIGGATLDENIIDYLTFELDGRITLGEKEKRNNEIALDSKQYLLLKNVKQAKMLLSDDQYSDDFSVPVSIWKEVEIQKEINKAELKAITGVDKVNYVSVANQIVNYISNEIKRIINYDVNKILLSGGLVETLGLFDYIVELTNKLYLDVEILKIDHNGMLNNKYDVLHYEDSVYCAALGGIRAALGECKLKTVLPYTY